MGKRKSAKKPVARRALVLQKTFDCTVCNHEKCINILMNTNLKTGIIQCQLCNASFQTTINELSSEIDVYAEWIDSFEPSDQKYIEAVRNSALKPHENPFKPAPKPSKSKSKSLSSSSKPSNPKPVSPEYNRRNDEEEEEEEYDERELFGSDDDDF